MLKDFFCILRQYKNYLKDSSKILIYIGLQRADIKKALMTYSYDIQDSSRVDYLATKIYAHEDTKNVFYFPRTNNSKDPIHVTDKDLRLLASMFTYVIDTKLPIIYRLKVYCIKVVKKLVKFDLSIPWK